MPAMPPSQPSKPSGKIGRWQRRRYFRHKLGMEEARGKRFGRATQIVAGGPRDSLAPSCGEAPKRNALADQEAQGDSARSVNQPAAQVLPAASEVDTGKGGIPTLSEAAGDTSSVLTGESPRKLTSTQGGERKDANELPLEKSGVQAPTNVAAAPKRSPASKESAETSTPGTEEPPAKTLQERWPTIRPCPNFPADKCGGNVEPVGQSTGTPDGTTGDGIRSSHGLDAKGERNAAGFLSYLQNDA
ncbi:hypothetical protein MRX96_016060 [Rhipicephalus microplus]